MFDPQRFFQLAYLLYNLLQRLFIAPRNNRNARNRVVVRRRYRQRIYVEAAPTKQAGNTRQYARIVLYLRLMLPA